MKSLEEDINNNQIQNKHFTEALEIVKPRIGKEQIEFYERYSDAHKRL